MAHLCLPRRRSVSLSVALLLSLFTVVLGQCGDNDCCVDLTTCCTEQVRDENGDVQNEEFGFSVSTSEDWTLASSPIEEKITFLDLFTQSGTPQDQTFFHPSPSTKNGFGHRVQISRNFGVANVVPNVADGSVLPIMSNIEDAFDDRDSSTKEVFFYELTGTTWAQIGTLSNSMVSNYGTSLALTDDTVAIGYSGGVEVFNYDSGVTTGIPFTISVAVTEADGTTPYNFPVTAADRPGVGWSVAINEIGTILAVGNPIGSQVFIFERSSAVDTTFVIAETLNPSGPKYEYFGWSVSLGVFDALVVGAPTDNPEDTGTEAHAFSYRRILGSYASSEVDLRAEISSQYGVNELLGFGYSVAARGDLALVGAPFANTQSAGKGRTFVIAPNGECILATVCDLSSGQGNGNTGFSVSVDFNFTAISTPNFGRGLVEVYENVDFLTKLGSVSIACDSLTPCGNCMRASDTVATINITPVTGFGVSQFDYVLLEESGGAISRTPLGNVTSFTVPPGTYSIEGKTTAGCLVQSNVLQVTQDDSILISLVPFAYNCGFGVSCNGAMDGSITATVSGGCNTLSLSWSNGGSTATISNLAAGTYTLTVTDESGSSEQASETLTEPELLSVSLTESCPSSFRLDSTVSGGCAPYTYSWVTTNGTPLQSPQDGPFQDITAPDNFTLTVTDANGCTAEDFQESGGTVMIDCASASPCTCIRCFGDLGSLNASVSLPTFASIDSYSWSGPGGEEFTTSSSEIMNATVGLWALTLNTSPSLACPLTATFDVDQPAAALSSSVVQSCSPSGASLTTLPSFGCGSPSYFYNWTALAGNISSIPLSQRMMAQVDNITDAGTYQVTVTDSAGCEVTTSVKAVPIQVGRGPIDFNGWSQVYGSGLSIDANGVVAVTDSGLNILQSDFSDGFQSDYVFEFSTPSAGGDLGYIGLLLGCNSNNTDSCYLVDINGADNEPRNPSGTPSATAAFRISRITTPLSADDFWTHSNAANTQELFMQAGPWTPSVTITLLVHFEEDAVVVSLRDPLGDWTVVANLQNLSPFITNGPVSLYLHQVSGAVVNSGRRLDLIDLSDTCSSGVVTLNVDVFDFFTCGAPEGYNYTVDWDDGFTESGQFNITAGQGSTVVSLDHSYSAVGIYFVEFCATELITNFTDCTIQVVEQVTERYLLLHPRDFDQWIMYNQYNISWFVGPSPTPETVRLSLLPPPGYGHEIVIEEAFPIGRDLVSYIYIPHHLFPWPYTFKIEAFPPSCPFEPDQVEVELFESEL